MIGRIELQPAYVLHTQPFRNTSLLVDFFCLDYGRLRAVARGARRPKSAHRSRLQPFQPLLVSLSGRGEVKTLTAAECSVVPLPLSGMRLFSGLYMNELLSRLLQFNEGHAPLYQSYQNALLRLHAAPDLAPVLRGFELDLLRELGYELNLYHDCESGLPIRTDSHYHFDPEEGFRQMDAHVVSSPGAAAVFRGSDLIALRESDFSMPSSGPAAKRLLRQALQIHLGDKPLASRRLFLSLSLSAGINKG